MSVPVPGSILCVGDLMVDVLARLPGPLAVGSDTPARVSFQAGGSAANTACWLGSLGAPVLFAGRVGNDPFGREAVAALQAAGVRPLVSVDRQLPTGVCIVLVAPDGERTMIPSAGANAALVAADLPALNSADHLHLSGYSLLRERSRPAALSILEQAQAVRAGISVDAASSAPIRAVGPQRFLSWLPPGALLLANADELAALTGADDQAAGVAAVVARGLDLVLKCGGRGSVLGTAAGLRHAPAERVEVMDSTGAGDAFAAGLLAARWGGAELIEALDQANRLGAAAVGKLGARPPGHGM
jgi:ribokinase